MMSSEIGGSFRKFHGTKTASEKVIVAVKAKRAISKSALAWALAHVVRPGDCIVFLALFSIDKTGTRFLNLPLWTRDCGKSWPEELPDRICEISKSCSRMLLQFHSRIEIKVKIKVVSGSCRGTVAAEAKTNKVNWVVLDKKLKQEVKYCMEDLSCNIVAMKGSDPQILRLNLGCSNEPSTPFFSALSSPSMDMKKMPPKRTKQSTRTSSPDKPSTFDTRTSREGSLSSFDTINSSFLVYEENPLFERSFRTKYSAIEQYEDTSSSCLYKSSSRKTLSLISETSQSFHTSDDQYKSNVGPSANHPCNRDYMTSNIRDAVSLCRTSSTPPPLCSLCQHKAPAFGKPLRKFSYKELEQITDGFSNLNFLGKGGFGNVYRGVLSDGQVVAVKQMKYEDFQAETDFCREVGMLSCAQHRNVVLLIGFCSESTTRLLVYEYTCNNSLDFHLHASRTRLDWPSRLKIATGVARGLRYLHEDCRVGCIVHKDLQPKNILLTHDFEPLIADFGLTRQYPDMNDNDRAIRASGYLAPEYINGGTVSHKVDVYAFGVVLLELMTGLRIRELKSLEGKPEADDLLGKSCQFLDSCLASDQPPDFPNQLQALAGAASLCLRQDPELRPPMSKILGVLEGGDPAIAVGLDLDSVGCRNRTEQKPFSQALPLKFR